MFVRLEDVCLERGPRLVLDSVSAEIGRGWTGLVGGNGAGKTTLLELVMGTLAPTAGRVLFSRGAPCIAVVPQSFDVARAEDGAFLEAVDRAAIRLKAELHLDHLVDARWDRMSPGERRRVQIGAALYRGADVLLCDEPEAHLDAQGRELLVRAMRAFRGVGVLASHRRDLLDLLPSKTLWLERGRLTEYQGGYSAARARRDADARGAAAERERVQSVVLRARANHDEVRRRHASARRSESSSSRMKHAQDHDGRSDARKFRAEQACARIGRLEAVAAAKVARATAELGAIEVDRALGRGIQFRAQRCAGGRVCALVEEEIRAGDGSGPRLLGPTSLVVRSDTRVRLFGPNGAGKTTLLARLVATARADGVLHLPQVILEHHRRVLLSEVKASAPNERGRWLGLVAALGTDPDLVLASACPSPGEARKLLLARALSREAAALFLDEPTNDLDLPSIERLEDALAAYEGAIVLVTHDDRLAEATTNETWEIDRGLVRVTPRPAALRPEGGAHPTAST